MLLDEALPVDETLSVEVILNDDEVLVVDESEDVKPEVEGIDEDAVTLGGGWTCGPQGIASSRSAAWYRLMRLGPPQNWAALPVQRLLQLEAGTGIDPLPRTTPQ